MFVADIDGLFDAVVLQRLRHARRKLARLRLGGAIGQEALDHDRNRVHGHDQQHGDHADGDGAEILDHLAHRKRVGGRVAGRTALVLQKEQETKPLCSD
jgi:hypothetical protein